MIYAIETYKNVRNGKTFINTTMDCPDVDMKLFARIARYYRKAPHQFTVTNVMTSSDVDVIKNEYLRLIDVTNQDPTKSYHVKRQTSDATRQKMKNTWAKTRESRSASISAGILERNRLKKLNNPKPKKIAQKAPHKIESISREDVSDFFYESSNLNQDVESYLGISRYLFKLRLINLFGTSSYKKVRAILND